MSLLWGAVVGCLFFEGSLFLLLCIPLPGRIRRWLLNRFDHSSFASTLRKFFIFVFCIVAFVFLDAMRDVRNTQIAREVARGAANENMVLAKMFRSQRNAYISGFTLFLLVILNSFYHLVNRMLAAESECARLQAAAGSSSSSSTTNSSTSTSVSSSVTSTKKRVKAET